MHFQFSRIAALAAIFCAVLVLSPTALATPIGQISISSTVGGGATGNNNLIDFFPPAGNGFGNFTTGGGSVNYDGGTITAFTNSYGRIRDLDVVSLGALFSNINFTNFIQFYVQGTFDPLLNPLVGTLQQYPTWDITMVGGSLPAVNCNTNPGANVPCFFDVPASAIGAYTSPLVLTRNPFGGTSVRLDLQLLGRDSTGSIPWTGLMTAQISTLTPQQVAAAIAGGQSVSVTTWSLDMVGIPEPSTVSLALAGMALIGFRLIRRRS